MAHTDKTHLGEMAEFFPVAPKKTAQPSVIPTMRPGETREQALQRQQERTARIRKQIADRAKAGA